MLLHVANVLSADEVAHFRQHLVGAGWADGKLTAGYQSAQAKDNAQLPHTDPVARELSGRVLDALSRSALFFSAVLPRRIFPPLFNRYAGGQAFGFHIDNAIRYERAGNGAQVPVRTDVSSTLFLSHPEEYDGGELVIQDTYGTQRVKLAAGDLVVYPGTSLHEVTPVTRGERIASFFWTQSLVRDAGQRRELFDLDRAIQQLTVTAPGDPALVQLTGVYHNLLRRWSDA
ncbi:Fe2+-dependent dioxygenase [Arenimonas alkanexedens]